MKRTLSIITAVGLAVVLILCIAVFFYLTFANSSARTDTTTVSTDSTAVSADPTATPVPVASGNIPVPLADVAGDNLAIMDVDSLTDIYVVKGTSIKDIELPAKVAVNLNNSSTAAADVKWDTSLYNGKVIGVFTFPGTMTIPVNVKNPKNITASIKVSVVQPVIDPKPDTPVRTEAGSVIDECDNLSSWSSTDSAVIKADTKNKVSGSASLNITSNVAGGGGSFAAEFQSSVNMDLAGMNNMEFNFYTPDISQIENITVAFYSDKTIAHKNFYGIYIGAWRLENGWNRISRLKEEFKTNGFPAWNNINYIRITITAKKACKPGINLDRLACNIKGKAKLLFTFDDGWYNLVNPDISGNAFTQLSSKGFKATVWVNKSSSGVGGKQHLYKKLNEPDLDKLYAAGWDIGNHTVNHPDDISKLSDEQKRSQYLDNQNWLLSKGWKRGAYFAAYPSGSHNERLIEILQEIGVLAARTTVYGLQPIPVDNVYRLKTVFADNANCVPKVKQEIDNAVKVGSSVIFMIHKVENTKDPLAIPTAEFKQIVDYVYQLSQKDQIDVTTMSEWYNDYIGKDR